MRVRRYLSLILLSTLMSLVFPVVEEAGIRAEESVKIKETATGIRCDSVYNNEGYGAISYSGPYNDGYGGTYDWFFYGLVGPDGKYAVSPKAAEVYPKYNTFGNEFIISEGMICDYNKGYYDLNGNKAFDVMFYKSTLDQDSYIADMVVFPFHDGKALVQYTVNKNMTDGWQGWTETENTPLYVIDKKGNIIEQRTYVPNLYYGGEGLLYSTDLMETAVFTDYDGRTVLNLSGGRYSPYMGTFHNGYAWVMNNSSGLYGLIDRSGKEVVPCRYQSMGLVEDGLVAVSSDGKYGYVNLSNEVVIPLEYDSAFGAGEGLATVGKGGKYGFVDYGNKAITDFEYDDLTGFTSGVAYGIKNGELYVLKQNKTSSASRGIIVTIVTAIVAAIGYGGYIIFSRMNNPVIKSATEAVSTAETVKPGKISFGHRTVLLATENEKLVDFLKDRTFLKVRNTEYLKLQESAGELKPDLIIAEITTDEMLDEYLKLMNGEVLRESAHGLLLGEGITAEARKKLDQLREADKIIGYCEVTDSPYRIMARLLLPVMKPDVSSDASLSNIGVIADALGIPAVSSVLDAYSTGRDIVTTIRESEGKITVSDTATVIEDIASILGLDKLKNAALLVGDVKAIKAALDKEAGAYEGKKGIKAAEEIADIIKK